MREWEEIPTTSREGRSELTSLELEASLRCFWGISRIRNSSREPHWGSLEGILFLLFVDSLIAIYF